MCLNLHALPLLQLQEGLFYPCAIENAASAMEVMAVSARNTALLIQQYLSPLHPSASSTTVHADSDSVADSRRSERVSEL